MFAHTFHKVSSNENYAQEFMNYKNVAEQEEIEFESNNSETYNRPFTNKELEQNLSHTKNTAPGRDGIRYQMLKKMPPEAKQYLCKIFKKLWQTSYFQRQWSTTILIPIHKAGKPHNNSNNYRLIALTNCICKLLERLINERLIEHMEMNKHFNNI